MFHSSAMCRKQVEMPNSWESKNAFMNYLNCLKVNVISTRLDICVKHTILFYVTLCSREVSMQSAKLDKLPMDCNQKEMGNYFFFYLNAAYSSRSIVFKNQHNINR